MTTVVHVRNAKYDIYIGRKCAEFQDSIWRNPFPLYYFRNREDCLEAYKTYLLAEPFLIKAIPLLKNKALGCWCKPELCHGDVLAELANKL